MTVIPERHMEPVSALEDAAFEDYSVSTEIERLSFEIERAAGKWFQALLSGKSLPGKVRGRTHEMIKAVAGWPPRVLITDQTSTSIYNDPAFACAVIQHNFPFRKEPYVLKLYLPSHGEKNSSVVRHGLPPSDSQLPFPDHVNHACFIDSAHNFHRWFGVNSFMTVTPSAQVCCVSVD